MSSKNMKRMIEDPSINTNYLSLSQNFRNNSTSLLNIENRMYVYFL
jgi:hypothetical protein